MDWRCGSNGRMPILQVWSPEFKPVTPKKFLLMLNLNMLPVVPTCSPALVLWDHKKKPSPLPMGVHLIFDDGTVSCFLAKYQFFQLCLVTWFLVYSMSWNILPFPTNRIQVVKCRGNCPTPMHSEKGRTKWVTSLVLDSAFLMTWPSIPC
jgi:hypothetical protein